MNQAVRDAIFQLMRQRLAHFKSKPPQPRGRDLCVEPSEAIAFQTVIKALYQAPQKKEDEVEMLAGLEQELSKLGISRDEFATEILSNLDSHYEELVPQAARRILGQFWTPEPLAELMVRWCIRSPEDNLLDPGVGCGVFLQKAAARLVSMGVRPEKLSLRLCGYELAPTLQLISAITLNETYQGLGDVVVGEDYLLANMHKKFKAIVCNPPYTRHHHLPERYKNDVRRLLEHQLGVQISRFASLFVYFFLRSALQLDGAGRMAYLTPTELLEAKYSRCIIQVLRDMLKLRAIIYFPPALSVFPNVDTAACVTLVEGIESTADECFKIIELREWAPCEKIIAAIDEKGSKGEFDWGRVRTYPLTLLRSSKKISVHLDQIKSRPGWLPLRHFAKAIRGIATGANNFFVLNDKSCQQYKFEPQALRLVVTKTRDVQGYVLTVQILDYLRKRGKPVHLLYILPEDDISKWPHVSAYLKIGELTGIPNGVLVRTRKRWYHSERRAPPPILYTYLGRTRPRFIWNQAQAQALTSFLLIYPREGLLRDEVDLKAFLAILNSTVFLDGLRQHARSYGWGAIKIEPREIEEVPFPDFVQIPRNVRENLASLFDSICTCSTEEEDAIKESISRVICSLN